MRAHEHCEANKQTNKQTNTKHTGVLLTPSFTALPASHLLYSPCLRHPFFFAGIVAVVDVDVMPTNRKRRSTGGDLHKSTQNNTAQHSAAYADGATWQ